MKKVLLASVATLALATSAFAADVNVGLSTDITQNANDKFVADTSIDIDLTAEIGNASLGLVTDDNDAVKVDTYSLGTVVSGVAVSYGDQGDLFDTFEGNTENVGGTTLANLDDDGESVRIGVAGVSVQLNLTDVTEDITDISDLQATYSIATSGIEVGTGVNYNLDSEEMVLLSRAGYAWSDVGLGLTGTYELEAEEYGYEADVTAMGVTAFVNGDNDEMLQNVGAGYYTSINGMGLYAEGAYNLDSEAFTPSVGASFNF
jgi:opacity protein-like surface antigen